MLFILLVEHLQIICFLQKKFHLRCDKDPMIAVTINVTILQTIHRVCLLNSLTSFMQKWMFKLKKQLFHRSNSPFLIHIANKCKKHISLKQIVLIHENSYRLEYKTVTNSVFHSFAQCDVYLPINCVQCQHRNLSCFFINIHSYLHRQRHFFAQCNVSLPLFFVHCQQRTPNSLWMSEIKSKR